MAVHGIDAHKLDALVISGAYALLIGTSDDQLSLPSKSRWIGDAGLKHADLSKVSPEDLDMHLMCTTLEQAHQAAVRHYPNSRYAVEE